MGWSAPAGKGRFTVTSGGALGHIVHRVAIPVQGEDPGALGFGVAVHFSGTDWKPHTKTNTRTTLSPHNAGSEWTLSKKSKAKHEAPRMV